MKRTVFVALAVLLLALVPSSRMSAAKYDEEVSNDIYVSYGRGTVGEMLNMFAGVLVTPFLGEGTDLIKVNSTGSVIAGYNRMLENWFWLGGSLSYESHSCRYEKRGESGEFKTDFFTLAPMLSAKANWLCREHVALYSRIAAGMFVLVGDDSDMSASFAFQASPLGCEFGNSGVRGFTEFGFGMEGIVQVGMRFRF